ncbi:MAG: FUSC family protein [Lentisphaerota bacterium]
MGKLTVINFTGLTTKLRDFYREQYKAIHYCFPAAILLFMMGLLITFKAFSYLPMVMVTLGVLLYPLFDLTIYEYEHGYRLKIGILSSLVFIVSFIIGSTITPFGLPIICISMLLPVSAILLTADMPDKELNVVGVFITFFFVVGIACPARFTSAVINGLWILIGMLAVAIIYYFYYKYLASKIERKTVRLQQSDCRIKIHVSPRLWRFGFALYISVVLACCITYFLSNHFPSMISYHRNYWAPFFVFILLRYNQSTNNSYRRIFYRFIGTLFGLLLAIPIFIYIHNALALNILLLLFSISSLFAFATFRSYWLCTTFVTLNVMVFYGGLESSGMNIEIYRLVETIVAVLVAITAITIFQPILKAVHAKVVPPKKYISIKQRTKNMRIIEK